METDNKKNNEMVVAFERNNYFYGKLLTVDDFQTEQDYFHRKSLLLNRELEGSGILSGLDVSNVIKKEDDNLTMNITAGEALDSCGNLIIMNRNKASIKNNSLNEILYLYIEYKECKKDSVESITKGESCDENCCSNRILETFELRLYTSKENHKGVFLATLEKNENSDTYIVKSSERKIIRSNQEIDNDVTAHINSTDNPHRVRADQVGAIKSINLIQSSGGDIKLESKDKTIKILPDDDNKSINIELSETVLEQLHLEITSIKSNLNMVLRFLMDKALKYKLKAFSSVLEHFESRVAIDIVKRVKEAIDNRIYLSEKDFLTLMRHLAEQESKLIDEIKAEALPTQLELYEKAIAGLKKAMRTGNLFAIAVAQDEVCERAEWLVPRVERVEVPNIVSLDIQEAQTILAREGLLVGKQSYTISEDAPENTILTQTPDAGTEVVKGSEINIEIAVRPEKVEVPDLINLDRYDAEYKLIDAQLTLGVVVVEETSDDIEEGTVLYQEPLPNSEVDPGTAVN
ncbi:PASTA domain-containing protein, partial [Sulfurovum sp. bin170]|uniref:PASTA domain-containing protein n=1 Tax=Sulfurovum sp. bin170 TaxID=2695268 RepID=UPI0013DF30A5|nr:PASTA domain-containing protein [Sulfurovum sp. bin170]